VSGITAATCRARSVASGVRYVISKYRRAKPPKSYTSGVPAAEAERLSGADSQWALMMRMLRGLGSDRDQARSWSIHGASSNSGGAPWLR
jgi:hypothetical protein